MQKKYTAIVAGLIATWMIACNNKPEKKEQQAVIPVETQKIAASKIDDTSTAYTPPDISPMDMCYFPVNYPKLKMAKAINTPPLARIIYSRPHLEGRTLFGGILQYGEPWRLGANEATEIDLFDDAEIQNKKIKAGRYVLYCIPQPDQWTIILNSNIDSWGLHPDSTKDVMRFTIPVTQISTKVEYFTMMFEKTTAGADIIMVWENTEARLPISFK